MMMMIIIIMGRSYVGKALDAFEATSHIRLQALLSRSTD